jgi:hypothetical protein
VTKNKKSKTVDFFKDLYTYPPRLKIKCDSIDELYGDLILPHNYNILNHSFPFVGTLKAFFNSTSRTSKIIDVAYNPDKLELIKTTTKKFLTYCSDNYSNKHASINFYADKTKQIQHSIENIPTYAVVQGQQGEIVIASSKDTKGRKNGSLKELAYNFYGGFRNVDIGNNKLGLFFMSRTDAEVYLKEIATADAIGTKTFGLSIECISLDFAYRVTREYHPGIDFRFIPDLDEVKNLLNKDEEVENGNIIFEDDQQQLRFRKELAKIEPFLGILNNWSTPFSSFLSSNEYFKGVPIFIVQIHESPNSLFLKNLFETTNIVENLYGKFINNVDFIFSLVQTPILQGSIKDGSRSDQITNYVFFDKIGAIKFCNSHGGKIVHDDDKILRLDYIRKPQIFVHNLEDFLELWEETLLKDDYKAQDINDKNSKVVSIFDTKATYFVPSEEAMVDLNEYENEHNRTSLNKVKLFFLFKTRCFIGWTERFLNAN